MPQDASGQIAKQRIAFYHRDLQRLVALSFSAGELSKYAERWRVFIDRDGGSEAGARTLVRALHGRNKLSALVTSLKAQKPLVEWPEPPPAATVPQAPLKETLEPTPEVSASTPPDGLPPRSEGPLSGKRPLLDPFAEEAPAPTHAPRGLVRWLPSVATGLAGVAIGATAMYLLHPERKTVAGPPAGLARLASEHMRSRVDAVAEACQVPADGDSARDVLSSAFAECGVPEIRPGKFPAPPRVLPPSSPPPPARRVPARALRGRKSGGRSPSGATCLDSCHGSYITCAKDTCGSEPQSAAENAAWSRCLHTCQSRRMRCRLACR